MKLDFIQLLKNKIEISERLYGNAHGLDEILKLAKDELKHCYKLDLLTNPHYYCDSSKNANCMAHDDNDDACLDCKHPHLRTQEDIYDDIDKKCFDIEIEDDICEEGDEIAFRLDKLEV